MRWLAAAVHLFTSLGAACALFATLAIFDHDAVQVFMWLGLAFIIDGIDGTFARAVNVSKRLPRFSGDRLDLVVDYVTYVFVPILALVAWGYLAGATGRGLAAAALVSSLYHFSDLDSKTKDNCFLGFPAIWNIVAFYVFAFDLSPATTAVITLACAVATFVPMPWVHPLRVRTLRPVSLSVMAAFAIASVAVLASGFPAGAASQAVLALVAAYVVGLAVVWYVRPPLAR